jgi:hypothetical protein
VGCILFDESWLAGDEAGTATQIRCLKIFSEISENSPHCPVFSPARNN